MKSIAFVLGVTLALTTACGNPAPTPRYQLAAVGEPFFATVYRLDVVTGEVHTYFLVSPKTLQRYPDAQAAYQELASGSRLVPGPTAK